MNSSRKKVCSEKNIDRIYIDYDKVTNSRISKDAKMILDLYPTAIIEVYKSGTKGHYTAIVIDINIKFSDAVALLGLTACSHDYLSLVMCRGDFFIRVSPKYVKYKDKPGKFIVPKPELSYIIYTEYRSMYRRKNHNVTDIPNFESLRRVFVKMKVTEEKYKEMYRMLKNRRMWFKP